jgi:hypothetical protein
MLGFLPSQIAAASVYLARKLSAQLPHWVSGSFGEHIFFQKLIASFVDPNVVTLYWLRRG